MAVTLTFRGEACDVPVTDFSTTTISDLSLRAQSEFGLATCKLLLRGRQFESGVTLADAGFAAGARVMVVGSTAEEIDAFQHAPKPRVRDDLTQTATAPRVGANAPRSGPRTGGLGTERYGFGEIRVLEGFADKEAARAVLERVATDPGIVSLMRSRRWFVPVLSEMYPDGKVGVDPVCVLGWNKNMGQEISLRIRTDDLLGFRKWDSVKKVVWHELAHNVRSEHDGVFYDLVSELEREGNAGDWTQGPSRRLGGDRTYERFREDMALPRFTHAYESREAPAFEGGHGLTGGSSSLLLSAAGSTTDAIAAAARARIAAARPPGAAEIATDVGAPHTHEHASGTCCPHDRPDAWGLLEESGTAVPDVRTSPAQEVAEATPSLEPVVADAPSVQPDAQQGEDLDLPEELREQQRALAARRTTLQRAVESIRLECLSTGGDFKRTVATLHGIVHRACEALAGGDPKYLGVHTSSAAFTAKTSGSASATAMLRLAGFASEPDGWMRLHRDTADVAALWLARDVLQAANA